MAQPDVIGILRTALTAGASVNYAAPSQASSLREKFTITANSRYIQVNRRELLGMQALKDLDAKVAQVNGAGNTLVYVTDTISRDRTTQSDSIVHSKPHSIGLLRRQVLYCSVEFHTNLIYSNPRQ